MVTLQDQRITMVACGDTFTMAVSEGRLHALTVTSWSGGHSAGSENNYDGLW